jgi:hypothetical protein
VPTRKPVKRRGSIAIQLGSDLYENYGLTGKFTVLDTRDAVGALGRQVIFRIDLKPGSSAQSDLGDTKVFARLRNDIAFMDQVQQQVNEGNISVIDALSKLKTLLELTK